MIDPASASGSPGGSHPAEPAHDGAPCSHSWLRTLFPLLGVGTAATVLTYAIAPARAPVSLSRTSWVVLLGIAIHLLLFGFCSALGDAVTGSTRSWRSLGAGVAAGARIAWPAALPLLLLPLVNVDAFHRLSVVLPPALVVLSVLLLVLAARRSQKPGPCGPRPLVSSLVSSDERPLSGWTLALLGVSVCVSITYLLVAAHAAGNNDNDAAYYYGVARHIAMTGRFEEPIVWHFLTSPDAIHHRPFDYWQGLTSLVLVPPLRLFGATHRVALLTMGVISSLSLLLFWYLVATSGVLRHVVAQLAALLTFALSPAMRTYRFDTETIPVAQLLLVAALIAWVRRRYFLCTVLTFLLVLNRADGAIYCAVFWGACVLGARKQLGGWRDRRLLGLAGTMVALSMAYLGVCLALYGTLGPPGVRLSPFLERYHELYAYGVPHRGSLGTVISRLEPANVAERARVALDNWRTIDFVPLPEYWFFLIILPGLGLMWERLGAQSRAATAMQSLVWILLFGGSSLIAWSSPIVFANHRTLYAMLPFVILAGAFGIDALDENLRGWQTSGGRPLLRSMAAGLCLLLAVGLVLSNLKPYGQREQTKNQLEDDLASVDGALAGEAVASMRPWYVIATTRSPALMIPQNGEAAIESALRRYGVRWLLLTDEPCVTESRPVCDAIRRGRKSAVGQLELELALTHGTMRLYRVRS